MQSAESYVMATAWEGDMEKLEVVRRVGAAGQCRQRCAGIAQPAAPPVQPPLTGLSGALAPRAAAAPDAVYRDRRGSEYRLLEAGGWALQRIRSELSALEEAGWQLDTAWGADDAAQDGQLHLWLRRDADSNKEEQ